MKKLLLLFLLLTLRVSAQINNGGGGSLPAGSVVNGIVQSGLIGQYDFNQGSGTSLTDVSTNGNNGTLCAAGAAPTWGTVASGGGLTFASASSQCVTLPAALNSAATIQLFVSSQYQSLGGTTYSMPITGNGAAANSASLIFLTGGGIGIGFNNTGQIIQTNTYSYGAAGFLKNFRDMLTGTGLVSWVLDATNDQLYFNGLNVPPAVVGGTGGSAGKQTAGVYQLGGRGSGYINGNTSFWSGTIYYAVFYNRELSAAEVNQNAQAILAIMTGRGVPSQIFGNNSLVGNVLAIEGDSLPSAGGGWTTDAFVIQGAGAWQALYPGRTGQGATTMVGTAANLRVDGYLPNPTGIGITVLDIQIGTNDISCATTVCQQNYIQQVARYIQQRKAAGWRTIVLNTILDETANQAGKNAYNALLRANWKGMGADYLADVASNPNLGADNASAGAYFNVDHIHPNAVGQAEIAETMQRTLNRILGNTDFSSANTYTTAAPAATTITAATEATNTVTLTFGATPANFIPGTDLTVAGVTPAGYNGINICHIVTKTATQVTCQNPNVSLGAGSIFGTAIAPQQLDQDVYAILGGSAAGNPSFTLESCQGWTGQNIYLKNTNTTSAWVLTPQTNETIDTAATLTMPTASSGNFPVVILQSQLVSGAAAGCTWKRLQ